MDRLYRHCLIMHQPTAPERAGCLHTLRHTCLDPVPAGFYIHLLDDPGVRAAGVKGLSSFPASEKPAGGLFVCRRPRRGHSHGVMRSVVPNARLDLATADRHPSTAGLKPSRAERSE